MSRESYSTGHEEIFEEKWSVHYRTGMSGQACGVEGDNGFSER